MKKVMKLKNLLIVAFLTLTLLPGILVSGLLYTSGLMLSKKSYIRNLTESIGVQVDYIGQTLDNNMILDYRFSNRKYLLPSGEADSDVRNNSLLKEFQLYLESSEDKLTACILLNKNGEPIYTIGENSVLKTVGGQLSGLSELDKQTVMEFELDNEAYSLGIVTPIRGTDNSYEGCLISVYDESYIFKIISSYYKVVDSSVYIFRENGKIVSQRGNSDPGKDRAVEEMLGNMNLASEGVIDVKGGHVPMFGYYKNICNSPWYLAGFADKGLITDFANQFLMFYIAIIIGILIVDIFLSFYFANKVVEPLNRLIRLMEDYQNDMDDNSLTEDDKNGYFETKYLRSRFISLMKKISMVQHNFRGIYQLYQSSDMGDINIDIDVKQQKVYSNKIEFQELMNNLPLSDSACVVERFTGCFGNKDQIILTEMFENMRDEHLAVTREAEIYTPYLNERWYHSLVVPMYEDERLSRLFIQLRDISSFKKKEYKSSEQARRDPLTGLYNRSGFSELVESILQTEGTDSDIHGLLFIDMNYFKLVNDNLGHREGDELLTTVSRALLKNLGADDIVSRFGGDEFAVFLPYTSSAAVEAAKKRLEKKLVYPFKTEQISFTVSASIGISCWEHSAPDTLEKLLHKADTSMYQAKRDFKQTVESTTKS